MLRAVYHALFDPSRRSFYSQFVRPDDLVFDVGANVGNYTEALLGAGARVVAIEPDPKNVEILENRFTGKNVQIESCAMGQQEGTAELYVGTGKGDRSTLSPAWARSAQCSESIQVPISTLDVMAKRYGLPRYVKIDTEGFDAEVLRGMSFRPEVASFEFAPLALSVAVCCINLLPGYEFNFALGEKTKLELDRWVAAEEMVPLLSVVPKHIYYGDVFAKHRD
jgi:FkbM family methyltransferase